MKRTNTYEQKWEILESPYKNRDMKHMSVQEVEEQVHVFRLTTYLILFALFAVLAWATERDNHPYKEPVIEAKNDH